MRWPLKEHQENSCIYVLIVNRESGSMCATIDHPRTKEHSFSTFFILILFMWHNPIGISCFLFHFLTRSKWQTLTFFSIFILIVSFCKICAISNFWQRSTSSLYCCLRKNDNRVRRSSRAFCWQQMLKCVHSIHFVLSQTFDWKRNCTISMQSLKNAIQSTHCAISPHPFFSMPVKLVSDFVDGIQLKAQKKTHWIACSVGYFTLTVTLIIIRWVFF